MRRILCWLGIHRFVPGEYWYGTVLVCQNCGEHFRMVRDGMTDGPRFDHVDDP